MFRAQINRRRLIIKLGFGLFKLCRRAVKVRKKLPVVDPARRGRRPGCLPSGAAAGEKPLRPN